MLPKQFIEYFIRNYSRKVYHSLLNIHTMNIKHKVDWFVKTILCYFLDALTIYNITQKV